MKINNLLKKAALIFATVILMISSSHTQVLAADAVENTGNKSTTEEQTFSFYSCLVLPKETIVPPETISYNIVGEAETDSGRIAGPNNGVTINSAVYVTDDDVETTAPTGVVLNNLNSSSVVVSKKIKVVFPANTFTTVGKYRYKITQSLPAYSGINAVSAQTQYLDVIVQNASSGNGLEVAYYVLTPTLNNELTSVTYRDKSWGFENKYDSYTLSVKKEVQGNHGDKTKEFSFPITITSGDNTAKKYRYKITRSGTTTVGTLDSGVPSTIKLKNDDKIEIIGLTQYDTYNVSEVTELGYEVKYKIGTNTAQAYTQALSGSITESTLIQFININSQNAPTGVILGIMPYILMIVLALGMGVLFFRRKRS